MLPHLRQTSAWVWRRSQGREMLRVAVVRHINQSYNVLIITPYRGCIRAVEQTVLQQKGRAVAQKGVTLHLTKTHTTVAFAAL